MRGRGLAPRGRLYFPIGLFGAKVLGSHMRGRLEYLGSQEQIKNVRLPI